VAQVVRSPQRLDPSNPCGFPCAGRGSCAGRSRSLRARQPGPRCLRWRGCPLSRCTFVVETETRCRSTHRRRPLARPHQVAGPPPRRPRRGRDLAQGGHAGSRRAGGARGLRALHHSLTPTRSCRTFACSAATSSAASSTSTTSLPQREDRVSARGVRQERPGARPSTPAPTPHRRPPSARSRRRWFLAPVAQ
jgi:hypothetical protein